MLISFFCIATEPFKNKYPIIESIKSILPLADEVVVVLGRNEKESEKEIRKLGEKIKIYKTHLWPKDWIYDIMTYHFDYALKKCTGDFCVKFDIDYVFKYDDEKILREIFTNNQKYHKIYLPKYNYLDNLHWMIYKKGIYCINRKLILEENENDMDRFYVGNKNYVNELIIDGKMREYIYEGKDIKVFNYDCSFMDKNLFIEKHYRWYNAYYKKWGNLDHFGLKPETLKNKEKLLKFVIDRTKDRIEYAAKNGNIYFDSFKFNPNLIRGKLRELKEGDYGYNFFDMIKLSSILYDKLPNDKKILLENKNKIRKYFSKLEGDFEFLSEKDNTRMIEILNENLNEKFLKISKFL